MLGSALAAIEHDIEHEKCMGFDMFDLINNKSNMSNPIHFSCSMSGVSKGENKVDLAVKTTKEIITFQIAFMVGNQILSNTFQKKIDFARNAKNVVLTAK